MVDFAGAAIGAVFGQLLALITTPFSRALKFEKTRKILADRVERLTNLVQKKSPSQETDKLTEELEECRNLLTRYSNIRCWQLCCLPCYQDQLQARDDSLSRSLQLMAVETQNAVMEILSERNNSTGRQFTGLCAPEKPDFFVRFDDNFNKSKIDLLKEGSSVLVLTGLAGSGKTTLAKKLCWDEQVKEKFRENILFVTFSQSPDLKLIVQKLFQHYGYKKPMFLDSEDASNGLVLLLQHIGKSPILLVLDDVWRGSDLEHLIEKLKRLSYCTILVTSRVKFPRFRTACSLKPLGYEDAKELFCHHLAPRNDSNSYVPSDNFVEKNNVKAFMYAINRLGILLRQIGRSPMLLVLDDVWPGSESLVENHFQMPDYKILVTSRVAFPRFGPPIYLEPLCYDDAITLFRHFAHLNDHRSYINDDLVPKVVRSCGGSPLALKMIGKSLCGQQIVVWRNMVMKLSKGPTTLDSNTELLACLQKCLDVLEEKPRIKECFMDLGLFPVHQMIPAVALIDMWGELHKLDDEGIEAMDIINEIATKNLADLRVTRKAASDEDNYYNNHFLMQHDLLRELAIYQSSREPFEHRKRIIIDVKENNIPREWEENQQGIIGSPSSLIFPRWLIQEKQQVTARILSISTDESLTPKWGNFQPAEVEVLVLNLRNQKYAFPNFMTKMRKVKVLIVTNYSFHSSELSNFMLLGSLSNLKRIRLEKVSVPSLCKLKNLQKLSLYMCNMSQAFQCHKIRISDALPNLAELNIDYGKDLVELPVGICDIIPLRKLSITNCHQFLALPQEIGKLQNLEVLRLSLCSKFEEIPNSINNLHKLTFLDISYCISLCKLADDMGNLCNLRKLCMTGCSRLRELPLTNLVNLEAVICDKETALLLEDFEGMLPNLKIEVPEADINLNWLRGNGC